MNKQQIEFMIGTGENVVTVLEQFQNGNLGDKTIDEALKITIGGLYELHALLEQVTNEDK